MELQNRSEAWKHMSTVSFWSRVRTLAIIFNLRKLFYIKGF